MNLLKRLRHQSLKRGTSENGIILGSFAESRLDSFSSDDLEEYQGIINESDVDLFNWMSGLRPIPTKYQDSAMFSHLLSHYQSLKKVR